MPSRNLRVGVLTGGGDCPGLNAVIRAVTKSLIVQYDAEVIGFEDGFLGLIEQRTRPLSFRDVSGILTHGGTILGASNKANPFDYAPHGGADVSAEIVSFCEDIDLDGVVAIGGDGTMAVAHGLQQRGVNLVGVPKTIDNDLMATDRTFGFDTAVSIATKAIDRLHTTAQSHHRVMILETMGRYAGWIALHAGVASGSDIILIPEFPYDIEEVARVCQDREDSGQQFTIICVAEGARPEKGEMVVKDKIEDSPDPVRLGGVGERIQDQLEDRLRSEIRTTTLGHVQRGGTPTAYDRNLATSFGSYAAFMIAERRYGHMVALQENRLTSVPFEEVAGKTRKVPPNAPMLTAALSLGTSFGVRDLEASFSSVEEAASAT